MDIVLALAVAATWSMVGLIWFVQIVHYPLLGSVPFSSQVAIANRHQHLTGFVVGPLMAVEAITAVVLVIDRPDGVGVAWPWVGLAALGVALASTAFVQVPIHQRLARRPDVGDSARLVRTNWVRTVAWSLHGVAVAAMVTQAI
ncbi:MAG: hypothetical protein RIE08_16490 [Acidimicrobiales bacterium]